MRRGRRDDGLVCGQPVEAVRAAGVHGRANPRAAVASPGEGVDDVAKAARPVRLILASASPARRELLARWAGVVRWRRPDDLQVAWQEVTRVAFAPLGDEELERYLATRSWRGHSGSYAIEETDDPYVRVVRGSLSNVIGLPMESLTRT